MSEDYYYQLNMKNIGEYASGQSRLTVNQFEPLNRHSYVGIHTFDICLYRIIGAIRSQID